MKNRCAFLRHRLDTKSMVTLVSSRAPKSEFPAADKPDTAEATPGPAWLRRHDTTRRERELHAASPRRSAPTLKALHQAACEYAQIRATTRRASRRTRTANAKLKSRTAKRSGRATRTPRVPTASRPMTNTGPAMIFNDRLYYPSNQAGLHRHQAGHQRRGVLAPTNGTSGRLSPGGVQDMPGQEGADLPASRAVDGHPRQHEERRLHHRTRRRPIRRVRGGLRDAAASTYAGDRFKKTGERLAMRLVRLRTSRGG